MTEQNLFFGAEVVAPWPTPLPQGRLVEEHSRHITLLFLGKASPPPFKEIPLPRFRVAPVAVCSKMLFLTRVVACELTDLEMVAEYQKELQGWLHVHDERPFLAHVTLAREPFDREAWELLPLPLPVFLPAIHLYESHPQLTYKPLWSHTFLAPFEEIEHTADIAYTIRAESLTQLQMNAVCALAFRFPPLMQEMRRLTPPQSLDTIIATLNALIAELDMQIGSPFKAVSYHGEIQAQAGLLSWEMIVDV